MKSLPKILGEERKLKLNYANCLFMKSRRAFRTGYNQPINFGSSWFTIKVVAGDETSSNRPIMHLHLRIPAKDRIYKEDELLDIDIYIPESEFNNITDILKNYEPEDKK